VTPIASSPTLTARQLLYLLMVNTFPSEVFLVPGPIIREAGKDALWGIVLAMAAAVLVALGVATVAQRVQRFGLMRFLVAHWGIAGRALLLAIGIALWLPTMNMWAGDAEVAELLLLPLTPVIVITAALGVGVLYGLSVGLRAVARLTQILLPIGLLVVVGLVIAASPWFNLSNALPLRPETSLGPIVHAAYQVFAFLGEIVFAFVLIGGVRTPFHVGWLVVAAVLGNGVMLFLGTMTALLMYGPQAAGTLSVPFLGAVHTIHYGFLVERVDILVGPVWVGLTMLKLIVWLLMASEVVAAALGLGSGLWPGIVAALLGAAGSLRLPNLQMVDVSVGDLWYRAAFPAMLVLTGFVALAAHRRARLPA